MKFKLDEGVSSPQDLKALVLEIHDYARWFSHNGLKKQSGSKRLSEQPPLSPAAQSVLREWHHDKTASHATLDELIKNLETYGRQAPTMTITLAAPPTGGVKKQLVKWCRDNINPNMLVNFEFNSILLGGMVVRLGSHIYDWSFRRQIIADKDKFPEVLRRV